MTMSRRRSLFMVLICLALSSMVYRYSREISKITSDQSTAKLFNAPLLQRFNTPEQDRNTRNDGPYDVIILTYMRSGSTFVGNLFGAREDTFYWYEPLWLSHMYRFHGPGNLVCKHAVGDCKNVTRTTQGSIEGSLEFLLDIYKCNLTRYFDHFTTDLAGRSIFSGATGTAYQNCLQNKTGCGQCLKVDRHVCAKSCPETSRKLCFSQMQDRCEAASIRVTKVLRLASAHTRHLLENHPRLKLIQVFRDPRAVISSGKHTGWYKRNGFKTSTEAKILCERMEEDMITAELLQKSFPGRVKIVQYEDFYDAYRTAVEFYDFLGIEMTDSVKALFVDQNKAVKHDKIATFHPDSFRYKLDWGTIASINANCRNVIGRLGLRMFDNAAELKNRNLSHIVDKLTYSLDLQ